MPESVSYPGVYVEEINSLALTVSSNSTAVPVFAISDEEKRFEQSDFIRISSWMDYQTKVKEVDYKNISDVSVRAHFINGGGYCYLVKVKDLEKVVPSLDDATLLVAAGQNIKTAVATLCQPGKNLFALLDGPTNMLTANDAPTEQEKYDASPFSAVYYPWLVADWAAIDVPPSAALAGVYSSVDRAQGVWKAPANVVLQGGLAPKYAVTDSLQEVYNKGKAFNMIRTFTNTGPTVWGARTLEDSDKWRYVPVRRLFNSVENDIKKAIQFAVFEPNNQPTWERVNSAITNYLYSIWQLGGLAGNNEKEAFFVQIGKGTTMTQEDINQGKMIVKVGIAAVRPAEFIILQFTQDVGQN